MEKDILTERQRKLIIDNCGLANDFIKKTLLAKIIPRSLEDDFISTIYWNFCISALKYKKEKGFKFSTYAYGGFNFGLNDIFRGDKKGLKIKNLIFLNDIEEVIQIPLKKEEKVENDSLNMLIENAKLTEREKIMLIDYYYNKLTFSSLGVKNNLSKQAARIVVKKVLGKLKRAAGRIRMQIEDFYIV